MAELRCFASLSPQDASYASREPLHVSEGGEPQVLGGAKLSQPREESRVMLPGEVMPKVTVDTEVCTFWALRVRGPLPRTSSSQLGLETRTVQVEEGSTRGAGNSGRAAGKAVQSVPWPKGSRVTSGSPSFPGLSCSCPNNKGRGRALQARWALIR